MSREECLFCPRKRLLALSDSMDVIEVLARMLILIYDFSGCQEIVI